MGVLWFLYVHAVKRAILNTCRLKRYILCVLYVYACIILSLLSILLRLGLHRPNLVEKGRGLLIFLFTCFFK